MNVLIVDPSRTFHHLVGEVFGEIGVRPVAATCLAEARSVLESQPIGYICSSLHLQDGSGLDLCRELRKKPEHLYTPFLLLTSDPPAEVREAAFRVGATDIFEKVQIQALAVFLRRLCRQYERTLGNVLVVEDSPSQARFYAKALEAVGLTVDVAEDGQSAMEMITQWSYDLIALDLVLPGEYSGVALVNQIRRLPGDAGDAPILALTAFDQSARRVELFYLGVNDYVSKPVSAEELVARVRNLIQSSRALRELRAQYQTSRSENAAQLSHDPMTGLYNRWHFESQLAKALHLRREVLSLAVIDVLSLRQVNDACGREGGDVLLKEVAESLYAAFPEESCAYLGGARLGIFTLDPERRLQERITQFIAEMGRHPFHWHGADFVRKACAGLVLPFSENETVASLLDKADSACHTAGLHPEKPVLLFDMANEAGHAHQWQHGVNSSLQDALDHQEFLIFHQPMLPGRPGLAGGSEVLIRMRNKEGMLVLPSMLLPAAELYGIAPRLDRQVTQRVCRALAAQCFPGAFASINLSSLTVGDPGFVEFLKVELSQHAIPAQSLMFEIAEAAVLSNQETVWQFMRSLRALGCRVALDNFGAGLNTAGQLRDWAVDVLKLDGRYCRDLTTDVLNQSIVRAARDISLAANLLLSVQFVEEPAQQVWLESLKVDWLQGYAIAHPQPLTDV